MLEVGPGTGNLTKHLLATGAHVVAVEVTRVCSTLPHLTSLSAGQSFRWLPAAAASSRSKLRAARSLPNAEGHQAVPGAPCRDTAG